jgi:hypothetical protein
MPSYAYRNCINTIRSYCAVVAMLRARTLLVLQCTSGGPINNDGHHTFPACSSQLLLLLLCWMLLPAFYHARPDPYWQTFYETCTNVTWLLSLSHVLSRDLSGFYWSSSSSSSSSDTAAAAQLPSEQQPARGHIPSFQCRSAREIVWRSCVSACVIASLAA